MTVFSHVHWTWGCIGKFNISWYINTVKKASTIANEELIPKSFWWSAAGNENQFHRMIMSRPWQML